MGTSVVARLLDAAGVPRCPPVPLSGGDMSSVVRCGDWVVKTASSAPQGLFTREAEGLAALARAGMPVPEVRWAGEEGLVMRFIPRGPPQPEALGRLIARMHSVQGPAYGAEDTVFLGRFALPAGTSSSWRDVWWLHRIAPLVRACASSLGSARVRRIEALVQTTPLPEEGPRLVHGDLWSGNVHHGAAGPVLIDPSVQWAERALDLAMMSLFGGFGERCMRAYEAVLPIPADVRASLPVHQLYYLLVHVHFFGAGYLGAIDRVLRT